MDCNYGYEYTVTYPVTDSNPTEYQSGECHSCYDENYCIQCTGHESNDCTLCIDGYYLDSGTCI